MLLGAHVSTAGGIDSAVGRGVELGCESVQIFPQSPRAWRPGEHSDEACARYRELATEAGLETICHAPYLTNLASPDRALVTKSVNALLSCASVAERVGASAVVFHVGSHLGAGIETGTRRAVKGIERALGRWPDDVWLLLENTAGAGGTMGRTVEELAELVRRLDHPQIGLCLDSAHLYASGVDVGDEAAVDALVEDVDASIGLDRLRALHINDSATELGSNRDRHANVDEGCIGSRMSVFLGHPALQGRPATLETPGHGGHGPDAQCMEALRRLHAAGVAAHA